jgi:tetratricopeptide (TPR) repeat protein
MPGTFEECFMSRAQLSLLVCAGLVALTIAAYGPLWRNDFIDLDDEVYVTKNPHVLGGLTPRGVKWAWTTFHAGFWFPLTWMSLQLDAGLFAVPSTNGKTVPWAPGFHAQNLIWHLATVLLLFATLRRMTGAFWRSALVAALFAVHPLHVESVAWATERKDTLSTFFWVLTMFGYVRYAEEPSRPRYAAVVISFVLGLLTKPMLVTLPFALLLLDWWPLRRWGWQDKSIFVPASLGRLILEKLPLLALSIAGGMLAVVAQRRGSAVVPLEQLSFSARLANAFVSYGWYLQKTFWPIHLAVYYAHPEEKWQWGSVLASAVVLLAVTLLALAARRRMPWLLVGWLWFLGTLVPVIGLLQVGAQAWADRFVYVPHIGLFVALVWTAADLADRLTLPAAVRAALVGGCMIALAITTWIQIGYWKDTPTIWRHALAVTENNHRAHANLAQYLFHQGRQLTDPQESLAVLDEARTEYEQAIAIKSNVADYEYDLGTVLLMMRRTSAAVDHFRAALRLNERFTDAWHNLGTAYLRQGRLKEATRAFRGALDINPHAADARALLGLALWRLHRHDEAEQQWQTALEEKPNLAEARAGMGLVLLRQNHVDEAVRELTAALRARPDLTWAWSACGIALQRRERWQEALEKHQTALRIEEDRSRVTDQTPSAELVLYHRRFAYALRAVGRGEDAAREYGKALQLDSAWPKETTTEAWRLATDARAEYRDPATALELASQACQALAEPSAEMLDTWAAALAANSRYEEAAKIARKALAKATPDRAKAIKARLSLYEQRKSYVAPPEEERVIPR